MDLNASHRVPQQLEAWLRYYADLGIASFYRDRGGPETSVVETAKECMPKSKVPVREIAEAEAVAEGIASQSKRQTQVKTLIAEIPHGVSSANAAHTSCETLEQIAVDLGECTRCKLHGKRNKIVFGTGNPRANLVFVGEGPGHDEDIQGLPFVGRAGKLLTQMIEAMGLRREDVYICNVVKCRPPQNRNPETDEIATCMPFLQRQLASISPKVVVTLGNVAAQALLGTTKSISHFRGQWFDFRGARLIATYHPAYLLRNPSAKADVWIDLQKAMAELGLPLPQRKAPQP